MKKLVAIIMVCISMFVLSATPAFCEPVSKSIDVTTDIGNFTVVINDSNLKSLSSSELQQTLKDVIEEVGVADCSWSS